jgi:hypothetical protein
MCSPGSVRGWAVVFAPRAGDKGEPPMAGRGCAGGCPPAACGGNPGCGFTRQSVAPRTDTPRRAPVPPTGRLALHQPRTHRNGPPQASGARGTARMPPTGPQVETMPQAQTRGAGNCARTPHRPVGGNDAAGLQGRGELRAKPPPARGEQRTPGPHRPAGGSDGPARRRGAGNCANAPHRPVGGNDAAGLQGRGELRAKPPPARGEQRTPGPRQGARGPAQKALTGTPVKGGAGNCEKAPHRHAGEKGAGTCANRRHPPAGAGRQCACGPRR